MPERQSLDTAADAAKGKTMASLYQDLKEAGVPIDNHCSDLYFKATPEAREILTRHPKCSWRYFKCEIDGDLWIEAPFRFDPYWSTRTLPTEYLNDNR